MRRSRSIFIAIKFIGENELRFSWQGGVFVAARNQNDEK